MSAPEPSNSEVQRQSRRRYATIAPPDGTFSSAESGTSVEGNDEEEEPLLKYARLGGDVPRLLSKDAATCLCVCERMVAVGSREGSVHVLDLQGNAVKYFPHAHSGAVLSVSFDGAAEFLGSVGADKRVLIHHLYSDEKEEFKYTKPMVALALDPKFAADKTRKFATGGATGELILNSRNWLGPKDSVIHGGGGIGGGAGEGPVTVVRWQGTLVAWANGKGVKVYDLALNQRVAFIVRPTGVCAEGEKAVVVWRDDAFLLVGWGGTLTLCAVRSRPPPLAHTLPPPKGQLRNTGAGAGAGAGAGWGSYDAPLPGGIAPEALPPGPLGGVGGLYLELCCTFTLGGTEGVVGLAPFKNNLLLLTAACHTPSAAEVRVMTWQNEELWCDVVEMGGGAKECRLAHVPSSAGCPEESLFFLTASSWRDIVVARPRSPEDHVRWLLTHSRHAEALEAVSGATPLPPAVVEEVGERYLEHLVHSHDYAQAAALCPRLLRGSGDAWERWVFHFATVRHLALLAPHVPTSSPRLGLPVYSMLLRALLTEAEDHHHFLPLLRSWPKEVVTPCLPDAMAAVHQRMVVGDPTPLLQGVMAELYLLDEQYDAALELFLAGECEEPQPRMVEYVEDHGLLETLSDRLLPLLRLDSHRCIRLLIAQRDKVPPNKVVEQLRAPADRRLLHLYLHALFEADPGGGTAFHADQVALYADFDPRLLLPFLRSSQHYPLDAAYKECLTRGLVREQVYLVGRMGNSREALALIVERLRDMKEAIAFAASRQDEELWEDLICAALRSPDMVGQLLEHAVGHIDPLRLLGRLPLGMAIPRLREKVIRVLAQFRTETALRQGCNAMLTSDTAVLLMRFVGEACLAVRVGPTPGMREQQSADKGGRGRCAVCLDPVGGQNMAGGVVTFFCAHSYHLRCLEESEQRGSGRGEEAGRHLRCILCTTAGSVGGGGKGR